MNYFTADLHLGSNEILYRENRPFCDINTFTKYFISICNSQTKPDDTIWVLGDFINYNAQHKLSYSEIVDIFLIIQQINAKVVLIIGNGEERIIDNCFNSSFSEFKNFCIRLGFFDAQIDTVLQINNKLFYLNHFPHKFY